MILEELYLLTEHHLFVPPQEISIFVALNGFLHLVLKLVGAVKINVEIVIHILV